MTVHKAKGLEFPVVFLPGLAAGPVPGPRRREPLALPLELVDEVLPEGDGHLQEERRLFYVAMTRARDELILSHAADYGGRSRAARLAVRRSRPWTCRPPASAARHSRRPRMPTGPLARIAAAEPRGAAPEADRSADRRAADAQPLRGRRLPDLPAPVQVRAGRPGPDRARTTR